jgi:hypothetical protein
LVDLEFGNWGALQVIGKGETLSAAWVRPLAVTDFLESARVLL